MPVAFFNKTNLMKKTIFNSFLGLIGLFIIASCSIDESSGLGGCTVQCGVVGLTTLTTSHYKFISKADCKKKAEESSKSCKVVYCPPSGNEEDCVTLK